MPEATGLRSSDVYYTPESVAKRVVDVTSIVPELILDPACGDGALLRQAMTRWPGATIVGLDIDHKQIAKNRVQQPSWRLGVVDLLSSRSRSASTHWREAASTIDLVLLNPPFSYRGGHTKEISYRNRLYRVSPALAFVALSLSRVRLGGELLALLPAGALDLEKDRELWAEIRDEWHVEVLDPLPRTTFSGTRTRAILVALRTRRAGRLVAAKQESRVEFHSCLEVVRGRVQVHRTRDWTGLSNGAPFVHTTDLAAMGSHASSETLAPEHLATPGPFLTLPRVGRVLERHVKIVEDLRGAVLSDCVFALRASDLSALREVQVLLIRELERLQSVYVGGCAPYLTIKRLVSFLDRRGYCCHRVTASGQPWSEESATAKSGCPAEAKHG